MSAIPRSQGRPALHHQGWFARFGGFEYCGRRLDSVENRRRTRGSEVSGRAGFTAEDAERQAGDAAANYFNRALRIIAGRFGLEKSFERDPAGFALQFAPLLPALIEAQSREYLAWVLHARLGEIAEPMASASRELSAWITLTIGSRAGGEL